MVDGRSGNTFVLDTIPANYNPLETMKALILTSAREHDPRVYSDAIIDRECITVGTSNTYDNFMVDINVTCDKSVIETLPYKDPIFNDGPCTIHYYTSWNGGRCDYFRPDLKHLPFQWKWSSGASAVLLMAYYGCDEIVMSKGLTRERIDGRDYTSTELLSFRLEQEELRVVMQQDWGYQTWENDDKYLRVSNPDPSKINKERWVRRAQMMERL